MLLVAIAAAVVADGGALDGRGGDWDLVFRVAVWGVAAGIVGARAYHVLTSWDEVPSTSGGASSRSGRAASASGAASRSAPLAGAIVVHRSGESV